MKRFHVYISVDDLSKSIQFYSTLFGSKPTVEKPDYAKWMLDEPYVNFAISMRGQKAGLAHLGIQVESGDELQEIANNLKSAENEVLDEQSTCCYAKSDKAWATDPQGIAWETFFTHGESTTYGDNAVSSENFAKKVTPASCCAPKMGCC